MLPYISTEKISHQVLSGSSNIGSHKNGNQPPRRTLQTQLTSSIADVELLADQLPQHTNPKLYTLSPSKSNRKRSLSYIWSTAKAPRLGISLYQTKPTLIDTGLNGNFQGTSNSIQQISTPSKKNIISNSQRSGLIKNHNHGTAKTPISIGENESTGRQAASQSHFELLQNIQQKSSTQSHFNGQSNLRSSLRTQNDTRLTSYQVSQQPTPITGLDISFNRDEMKKYPYESRLESPENTSDSEDPLSSSLFENRLLSKTPIRARPPPKDVLLSPSPISPSTNCPISPSINCPISPSTNCPPWSAASQSSSNSCIIEAVTSPKWPDRESPFSIKIESSSPINLHQIAEMEEPVSSVQIRPRKRYTKYPRPRKVRRDRGLYHVEVPVPDPVFYSFKCEWQGCQAELMNMEILRKHVCVAHGKRLADGSRRCLWRKCGKAWEDMHSESESLDSDSRDPIYKLRVIYQTKREWQEHMEECHMVPFSWHMGDGPCGSRLEKPSTVWKQPYLFHADGRQATPSVASQPIEEGKMRKLNARRFHWRRGGGPFGGDILVPIALFKSFNDLSSSDSTGVNDSVEDEEEIEHEGDDEMDRLCTDFEGERAEEEELLSSDLSSLSS